MPRINLPGSNHKVPSRVIHPNGDRSRKVTLHWEPYTDEKILSLLRQAMVFIDLKAKKQDACNEAFSNLPGKRSLRELWNDSNIWISFDPLDNPAYYGARHRDPKYAHDITISAYTFSLGVRTIGGTLIHELAHINGALDNDTTAEDTLPPCLFEDVYREGLIGRTIRSNRFLGVQNV